MKNLKRIAERQLVQIGSSWYDVCHIGRKYVTIGDKSKPLNIPKTMVKKYKTELIDLEESERKGGSVCQELQKT